uniref:Uncharacterized protein n=1 Tax=Schistocephalus solidus TaxID=70667 RepID=A0A0X3PNF6_SCHSO
MAKSKESKEKKEKKDKGKKKKDKKEKDNKEARVEEIRIRLVGDEDVISKIQALQSHEEIKFENTKFNVLSAMDANGTVQDLADDICLFCYDIRRPESLELLKTKLFDEAKYKMGKHSKYVVAAIGAEYRSKADDKTLVPAKALSDFATAKGTCGMEIFSSDSQLLAAGLTALKIREENK